MKVIIKDLIFDSYISYTALVHIKNISWQQRLREERDQKRSQLTGPHNYIISIIAENLGIDKNEVEESLLDGVQVKWKHNQTILWKSSSLIYFNIC